ncbi:LysR family transcriptional regulator [Corynebacterium guangdongense]|uniref:DNA-binding transcriptional LysR family regulator n=1 Tax=Corynebacterium guangdongense TaxID=1783348 RepID=A0ABU1ZTY8_9CORY|nr:LysR family transcriptional regulator [Corynebacterium guangdongense]MDR7328396.1 DNA-binding transcriptional LysR family regulator [Corynebacterium guangdongense]WJZ16973.1 HTH-type transcriptional regulator CysL [Corynebacterium guangdongense]
MDTRKLQYFRTVVEAGSFTAAAKQLHMAQPSLSVAVRELEKSFGSTLLERTPQGVHTTPEGDVVFALARSVDDQLEQAQREVRALTEGTTGAIRLTVAPEFNWIGLAEVIARARDNAPDLDITVLDPEPAQSIANVYAGHADIGVIPNSNLAGFLSRHEQTLAAFPLMKLDMAMAVPRAWQFAPGPVVLEDMVDRPLIMPIRDSWFEGLPESMLKVWLSNPATRPHSMIRVSTLQTALPLVAAGTGVAIVPELARSVAPAGVEIRPIRNRIEPLELVVIWNKLRPVSGPMRRGLAILREFVPAAGN